MTREQVIAKLQGSLVMDEFDNIEDFDRYVAEGGFGSYEEVLGVLVIREMGLRRTMMHYVNAKMPVEMRSVAIADNRSLCRRVS